ncbi:hypothetical protein YA0850_09020 [Pseudomonas veronii]|uniref:Uncharacterized protein n=1 Tax=Pseudomonas veronii TaxID=76761 RepID=A0ABS0VR39_PSEVE|nr:hypothetical protein [Pseudomonas veronii]MBI6552559.1 hypothetical protein [Pseudomonas veronii]MBI6654018.1 hypothetical protein [Pseudomonas veronii]
MTPPIYRFDKSAEATTSLTPGAAVALADGGRTYASAQFGVFFWAEDDFLGIHLRFSERWMTLEV